MNHPIAVSLGLGPAVFFAATAFSAASTANPGSKQPTTIVRCLPPGGTKPVSCNSLTAGSTIEFRTEQDRAQAPTAVYFRQLSAGGRTRSARADIQANWFIDHGMLRAKVPDSLCSGVAKGQRLQFEIQTMTSDLNQAPSHGSADSLGYFQMRC